MHHFEFRLILIAHTALNRKLVSVMTTIAVTKLLQMREHQVIPLSRQEHSHFTDSE